MIYRKSLIVLFDALVFTAPVWVRVLSVHAGRVMDAGGSPISILFGVQWGHALPRLEMKVGQTIQRTVSFSSSLSTGTGISYA